MRARYKPALLPKNRLLVTGPVDKAAWSYSPLLGPLQRTRFALIHHLIEGRNYDTILEVAYGSGVFLPDLATRCQTLLGVDVHSYANEVTAALAAEGVSARLCTASAEAMPLESGTVDLVVSISGLEYVSNKSAAAHELHRVLGNGGRLALVHPLDHAWLDVGLKILTGEDAEQYGEGRKQLIPSLLEQFSIIRRMRFPERLPKAMCVYDAVLLEVR